MEFWIFDFLYIFGGFWNLNGGLGGREGFPEPVQSILAEYGPARADGDPIYTHNYDFPTVHVSTFPHFHVS